MSVLATYALELYLSAAWVDVLAPGDVRNSEPIVIEYGIQGSTPNDRIGSAGSMQWGLDNSVSNSAGVQGYYSPLSTVRRAGYTFNVPVRFTLTGGATSGVKFHGRLSEINAVPGENDTLMVHCRALDWMDQAATLDLPDLPVQLDKRGDEIVTTILDALDADDQPVARDIETSLETFAIALDGGVGGDRPTVREVLNQICLSDAGYFYQMGDGTVRYENRHHRSLNPAIKIALDATMIEPAGLSVPGSRDDIYHVVQIFVKPTEIDTAATTVLFSLQTAITLVLPGQTVDTIFGPYRDPNNRDFIGGVETVDPVATTDYTMNTAANGTGADVTADFTVTASRTGRGVQFSVTNNGGTSGYITKLQVRGKGIYRFDAMIEVVVTGSFGKKPLQIVMPYQNNVNIAQDWATYLSNLLKDPMAHVRAVTFSASKSSTLMTAAIEREPGDRISINEVVTGIDAEFTINRVRLECQPGGLVWCTWGLEPADGQRYWLWGINGASNWGLSTVYGW